MFVHCNQCFDRKITPFRENYKAEETDKSNCKVYFDIHNTPLGSSTLPVITNVPDNKTEANLSCKEKIRLKAASLEELKWWCQNLNLNKLKPITIQTAEIIIQSDAAKSGG